MKAWRGRKGRREVRGSSGCERDQWAGLSVQDQYERVRLRLVWFV